MALTITPFDAALGAEISGLDCRQVDPADARAVRAAFSRYHLLVMHGDVMSDDALVNFGACFGNLEMSKWSSPMASRPEIMVISNVRLDGELVGKLPDGEMEWHFDRMHQLVPNKAAVLHACEIPSYGGETTFAHAAKAYDALPDATKRRIETLQAEHCYDLEAPNRAARVLTATTPTSVQPILKTIPETGERAMWVSPLMTERIVGLDEADGNAILDELYAQIRKPEFAYTHRWRVGDTLIWDNRCCPHRRNDFPADERRLLKRVTVRDD